MEGALNDGGRFQKGVVWIHWFRSDVRLIGVKKIAASKISGFVWAGPKGNVTRDDSQRRFLA